MMKPKISWKVLGLIATIAAYAINILGDYVSDRCQDEVIDEKITKALSEANEEN